MDEIVTWSVTIDIGEHDGHTEALARLHTRDTRAADRRRLPASHPPTATCRRSVPSSPPRARWPISAGNLMALATEDVEAVNRQPHLVQ